MKRLLAIVILIVIVAECGYGWEPAKGPLMTRWAKEVSPQNAHPEYPRPMMVRKDWMNLNGLWDYAITQKGTEKPAKWDVQILVPFPVESALSGVMKRVSENENLWYHRTFKIPAGWRGKRILLNFGAVDWEATVWVNGKELGTHRGGYDSFSFDITDALTDSAEQEIVVRVWDPTDAGYQPRGKQVRRPGGIWYTPTTGIWQTTWLEPVADSYIESVKITPDFDKSSVSITVNTILKGGNYSVKVDALDGNSVVQSKSANFSGDGKTANTITLTIPSAKPWSPDSPFLYGLKITLTHNNETKDEVESYFGMRKISLCKDEEGILRLCLNNKPLFQFGPLDQGFWPDGLYTAPTDEALRYDIEVTKSLGFNMARKHVKIEPQRWYYWCDKLGLLVWQDMPSGDKFIGPRDPDITRSPESAAQFEKELKAMVEGHYNHPCIVMWVPYNEGWGQWDTVRIVNLIKQWDPTRLVNNASGWTDRKVGDVHDVHIYPGPGAPPREPNRAIVLGEFGGLGLPLKGHTWQDEKNWGYRSFTTREELTDAYLALLDKLHPLTGSAGLSAAVYTQTTDVEVEVNGLMTYDREVIKMDKELIAQAAKKLYTPPPKRTTQGTKLVPPSTPLVACDPYFSIWSPADNLTDANTVHWTGRQHSLGGLIRIDGKTYRVIGAEPRRIPALSQKSLTVLPTRTIYEFEGAGINLVLTFTTPALPDDLDVLARPVTYIEWEIKSADGKEHEVSVYFDASSEIAVNETRQEVVWAAEDFGSVEALKIGSKDQPILAKKGDDLRIDWGYLYLAAPKGVAAKTIASAYACRSSFAANGKLPEFDNKQPRPVREETPTAAMVIDAGKVGKSAVNKWIMIAYDDLYSIQYMKKNLRPYWRRTGWEAADLLKASAGEYEQLKKRCIAFDNELMKDLTKAGGEKYAKICALAFRQCFAAGKFVADDNGKPISFCKENFSNGCIGTSDVFYPMAPQFLLFGPTLAKSFLVPFMNYAASPRWKFPFAPHDLGTYPHANGQVYGGGERTVDNQMPVEESGNLLILFAAVAEMEGNADFAKLYWKQLEQWANYLKEKGFDPENQLCTDDFAGHLAHNVNLSAKAICGLASFAKLCEMTGQKDKAKEYMQLAREFVKKWLKEADDGDHYRLAFDRPGTWSQKYNIVWDRILGFNLWDKSALRKEMDFYKKVQNKYGLPLDNRAKYTKLDWTLWTATLTQDRRDFDALIDPVFRFLNETPNRVPMTDWYDTTDARQIGFQARPVVGGVFLQMLYDKQVWKKYASRDKTKASGWAPMPAPPVVKPVVPTSENQGFVWRYTTQKPPADWMKPEFDDSNWKTGEGGFGTRGTPGARVRTEWNTSDIWLRREITLPDKLPAEMFIRLHHDEDAEIYINGVLALTTTGYTTDYEEFPLTPSAKSALRPGKNIVAIHCRQTAGGQYIDFGLVEVERK